MAQSQTSTRILDVAQELVQTRGFNAFSYADISEVVGIRKASIHYHFATKAQLGQALVKRYREEFANILAQIREGSSGGHKQLLELVEVYASDLEKNRLCLCGVLGTDILTLPPEICDEVRLFFEAGTTWLQESIEAGCSEGTLACDAPQESARLLLAVLVGTQLVARTNGWDAKQFSQMLEKHISKLKA